MAGRPGKPTEQLKKQGTYRKDRHEDRVFVEEDLSNDPPEWLDEDVSEAWIKWHSLLQKNSILKQTDTISFEMLCSVYTRVRRIYKQLQGEYIVDHITDKLAVVQKVDPRYSVLADSEKTLIKILTEFGMTPVARNKVKAALGEEEDPYEKLENS